MNSTQRQQRTIYIILLALILLNLPIYLVFVRPEIQADAGEQARAGEMRSQLSRRVETLNRLKEIEKKLNESHVQYRQFAEEYLFSADTGSSELLKELDAVCAEAGLLRNRVTYRQDAEPAFGMQRMAVTIPIEGNYANIRNFLNIVESESKLVIVDSISLASEREGTGILRLDVSLSTLFLLRP